MADAAQGTFTIETRGAFSLDASVRFLEGFAPAGGGPAGGGPAGGRGGGDRAGGERAGGGPAGGAVMGESGGRGSGGAFELALALEGSWQTVGVSVEQTGAEEVHGRVFARRALGRSGLSDAKQQVARILSLDVDGHGYAAVGEADPVIGAAQRRHPGLRPVCFWSWYEAAAWSIIGQRQRMTQAAAVKRRLAEQLGDTVELGGRVLHAFPKPAVLAELGAFPGLTVAKVERLRALGEAARHNAFSSAGLRAMSAAEAIDAVQQLPGVGPFSAELIVIRGAGAPDVAPLHEPRLRQAVAHAYGLDAPPDDARLVALAEAWAPYRSWASVLLRVELDAATR